MINWSAGQFNFKGTPSQEELKTTFLSLMLSSITLTSQSYFKLIFFLSFSQKYAKINTGKIP
jgi:hypothetical protein